jgi:hypothetical protein
MGFLDQLKAVWPLVIKAPWGFAALGIALLLAGWAVGRFMFGERLETLKSRIERRDEEIAKYKTKLDGATLEEVNPRVDRLEAQIHELEPRKLSKGQTDGIKRIAQTSTGRIKIVSDISTGGSGIAAQINDAFSDAGWTTIVQRVFDLGNDKPELSIIFPPDPSPPAGHAAHDALSKTGLSFNVQRVASGDDNGPYDAMVIVR